jgi:hypothetical protein
MGGNKKSALNEYVARIRVFAGVVKGERQVCAAARGVRE